jgi:hypothetical protein
LYPKFIYLSIKIYLCTAIENTRKPLIQSEMRSTEKACPKLSLSLSLIIITRIYTHARKFTENNFYKQATLSPFLFFLAVCMMAAADVSAQVGIRMDNPQGMLHVDAKGDTDVDQGTGIEDDVVVTEEGRIGLGTLDPQARLDARGSIRIQDGSEGAGKILTSDANGKTQWSSIVGSWYAALKGGRSTGTATGTGTAGWPPFTYNSYELSSPGTGSVDLTAGIIQVPYTATYRMTTTGKGHTNRSGSMFLSYLLTNVNETMTGINSPFAPHIHSYTAFGALNFGFMSHLSLDAGDKVWITPAQNYGNLYTDILFHIELVQ